MLAQWNRVIEMVYVETKQSSVARWWTPKRLQQVGLVGFLGCVLFALIVTGLNAYSAATGVGFDGWTFTVLIVDLTHVAAYALMVAVLVAASVRFDLAFGRPGRIAFALLTALIAWASIDNALMWVLPPSPYVETGFVYFLGIHLFMASIVGIVLWRTPGVRRLATGLFLIVTPMFILPAVLMSFGLPSPTAAAFEVPLILGVAVLGYQLWKESDPEQITATVETVNA